MRRNAPAAIALAIIVAVLFGVSASSEPIQGTRVPNVKAFNALDARVMDLEKRVDALEVGAPTDPPPTDEPTDPPTEPPTDPPPTDEPTDPPTDEPTDPPTDEPTDPPVDEPTDPPVQTGKCVGAANTPGGPDPWGGCWPGPHNTGYPKGLPGDTREPVKLTDYTGPNEIRECGVVIENKRVPWLVIRAGNGTNSPKTPCVTIRNSLVETVFTESPSAGPVLIEDTEFDVNGNLPYIENAGRYNMFGYRLNSHGGQGVLKCAAHCEFKDSWVHGMTLGKAYHYNAVGGNGMEAGSLVAEHNYLTCGDWESTKADVQGDAGCSAVIGFYGDFAPIRNVTIHRNFLRSTFDTSASGIHRQAGYCINPGYYPGKPHPAPSNMTITDNVFHRGGSGKCGVFGPANSLNAVGAPKGNVWSGNRYTDGEIITRPEE